MAGGKETPRQKMIGMMYLVLLAMLAMNVSKEIINAFVTINEKLVVSETALISKSDGTYQMFDQKYLAPGAKAVVKPWIDRAHNVQSLANGLSNFLVTECSDMIMKVEGKPWHETDEDGNYHLLPMMAIEQKDNYDVPTSTFSADGSGQKRGQELRNSIHNYRDSLCYIMGSYKYGENTYSFGPGFDGSSLVEFDLHGKILNEDKLTEALRSCNAEDTAKIANVYRGLSQPEFYSNHDEKYTWEMAMFEHAPIVAAGAMFTAFIVDVRNAESTVADFLYNKVQVQPFVVNKIEPMAFASSAYINQGESIALNVLIAAYDSTENQIIKYGIDADTANPAAWKETSGKIDIEGSSPGPHKAKGVIMVKEKGKLVPRPWEFKYTVGSPMGVVSLPEMNVLYKGYKNKVLGTASGFPTDKISLSGSGCSIIREGDHYIAKPTGSGGTATISVMGKKDDGSSVNLGRFDFRVKTLPAPSIYLGSIVDGSTVTKANLLAQTKLFAKYDSSILLNAKFQVISYKVDVTGAPREAGDTGAKIDGAKNLMRGVQPGGRVTFMVVVRGPDGINRKKTGTFYIR